MTKVLGGTRPAGSTAGVGKLYVIPALRRVEPQPLQHWPRARLLAELAQVDADLAALTAGHKRPRGQMQPIGPLARELVLKSTRKYRNRLARAL